MWFFGLLQLGVNFGWAFIITLLPELLRSFKDYRAVVNGLILVAIVLFLPKGIWGTLLDTLGIDRPETQCKLK